MEIVHEGHGNRNAERRQVSELVQYNGFGCISLWFSWHGLPVCWLLQTNICCGYRMATDILNWVDKNNTHVSKYHSYFTFFLLSEYSAQLSNQ